MTTIAYKDGVLAADTQISWGSIKAFGERKIHRRGRLLIGYCGASKNYEAFRSWIDAGMPGEFDSQEGNVFILPPSGPALIWGTGPRCWRDSSGIWSMGDGDEVALGAMEAGASAVEAVQIASRRTIGTGGEIHVLVRVGDYRGN